MLRIPDPRLRVCIRLLSTIPPSAIDELAESFDDLAADADVVKQRIAESDTLKLASISVLDELARHLDRAAHSWGLPPVERARLIRTLNRSLEAPVLAIMARQQLLSSSEQRLRDAYPRLIAPLAPYLQDLLD